MKKSFATKLITFAGILLILFVLVLDLQAQRQKKTTQKKTSQTEYYDLYQHVGQSNQPQHNQRAVLGDVMVYGDVFSGSTTFQQQIENNGFSVRKIENNEIDLINTATARNLIISGEKTVHPNVRKKTDDFVKQGGNVFMVGTKAFDYAPVPVNPVPIVDFANQQSYSVVKQERKERALSLDEPTIRVGKDDMGNNALEIFTVVRAMPDYMAKISIADKKSATRSVITFSAKGNAYMDLLALEIVDMDNVKWFAFVPLSYQWENYAISMADFIPENWSDAQTSYPLLDPNKVETLYLGVNLMTLWKEKVMYLGLSNVALAENSQTYYTPTSALNALRLPFSEIDITIPDWTFNPMSQAKALQGSHTLVRKETYPFGQTQVVNEPNVYTIPRSLVIHKGVSTGTDTKKEFDFRDEREKRIITLFETGNSYPALQIARLEIPTGGMYAGSTQTLFGIQPTSFVNNQIYVKSLTDALIFVNTKPVVAAVMINTSSSTSAGTMVTPKLKVTLKNPLSQSVSGQLRVDIAQGSIVKEIPVAIGAQKNTAVEVLLPEVPVDFPMSKFNWNVTFNSGSQQDYFEDKVDIERSMLVAFRHLINAQNHFPDGRYSNHYFGDAYGVRAMFAFLEYVKKNPDCLQRNTDIWQSISLQDIENSAYRFYDMLVERQLENGALPMGYEEHARGYNVADGGQIVLSIAQSLRYIEDEAKKNSYLNLIYKFADWTETYYIDSARSEEVKRLYPEEYLKGNGTVGHYGLKQSGSKQIIYGPSWVGSCILPVHVYLACWNKRQDDTKQRSYESIAARNIDFYINSMSARGYYQAEALFWTYVSVQDPVLKNTMKKSLDETLIPYLTRGTENDMFGVGGRNTLYALSMMYYRRFVNEQSSLRATQLKYLWTFASESSCNGMGRISEALPKPGHGESLAATKYAALSALWCMELLEPASTLFKGLIVEEEKPSVSLTTDKTAGSTISLSIRASNNQPENEDKVWIDLNNDKKKTPDEKVVTFGEKVSYTISSPEIGIYGPVWTLDCSDNELTKLNVQGAAKTLNQLSCYKNKLDTLDISNCSILSSVSCQNNLLKLIVTGNNQNLSSLNMYSNRVGVDDMRELMLGLPDRTNTASGKLTLYYSMNSLSQPNQNQFTQDHADIAVEKNWKTYVAIPGGTEFNGPYYTTSNVKLVMPLNLRIYSLNRELIVETDSIQQFSIYDMEGQLMIRQNGSGKFMLPVGMYVVQTNEYNTKITHK